MLGEDKGGQQKKWFGRARYERGGDWACTHLLGQTEFFAVPVLQEDFVLDQDRVDALCLCLRRLHRRPVLLASDSRRFCDDEVVHLAVGGGRGACGGGEAGRRVRGWRCRSFLLLPQSASCKTGSQNLPRKEPRHSVHKNVYTENRIVHRFF